MCVSGCVFKQVHTSCSSLRRTFLIIMTFSRARHEFSVFIARERFVSHMKSPYHHLTLLHILSPSYRHKDHRFRQLKPLVHHFGLLFFAHVLFVLANGDEPRRFFAGTISTHSNSTRIILTLFVFNTAKHIAIGISKSLRTTCTGRPSLRPSPSNPPGALRVSRAFTMAISAVLAFLHASKLCQLSGGPDRGALGTRISRWRGKR